MQELPGIIHPGSPQQKQAAILQQASMQKGKQDRQPEAMACKRGEQELLQRPGKCATGTAVASAKSGVLERRENKTASVTRSLVRK